MTRAQVVSVAACLVFLAGAIPAAGQYKAAIPGPMPAGAIEVRGPGACDQPGKTYILMKDITCDASGLFLAANVTLDLNGHTLTYAGAKYEHVPNYGFEKDLQEWDVSKAPGAVAENALKVKPFIGRRICRLPAGQEIVSRTITLPVAERSYYAMCGVLDTKMRVTIGVEDEQGRPVRCEFKFGDQVRPMCPQTGSPKLGGGFVFAVLKGVPAGKYRIRVRADTDCLIDEVDIRPALDVGIGIVDRTYPWSYYKCILDGDAAAFPDYTKPGSTSDPVDSVPRAAGPGTVTIRNGALRSGFEGIRSWGVQSTARDVTVVLDNVRVVASGINTNAASLPRGMIRNCRFEIDTPQIIDRHRLGDSAVNVSGDGAEVANSSFIGGQGCLAVDDAKNVRIHDNLFVNRQTVTNHYSIGLGDVEGAVIEKNRIEPEVGSGILVFRSRNCEIAHNTFRISAANANCEYTNEDYSTNAIRLTDYNEKAGSPRGAYGNRIHHNRFDIVGRHYVDYANFKAIATAFFVSVGAGPNRIEDNEIHVNHVAPGTPAEACAFYVTGDNGGDYVHNTVTTNVPAFWIATPYGAASNVKVVGNTIIKASGAPANFKPFRLGWWKYMATNVEFEGNTFKDCQFGIDATDGPHTYVRK